MANILIKKAGYIRGKMRKAGQVVEVGTAEARQYTSNGMAEDVTDTEKKVKNKAKKVSSKRKSK
jgi:hypothetical protein